MRVGCRLAVYSVPYHHSSPYEGCRLSSTVNQGPVLLKWTDSEWRTILKAVFALRYEEGKSIKQVTMCDLSHDIRKVYDTVPMTSMGLILHKPKMWPAKDKDNLWLKLGLRSLLSLWGTSRAPVSPPHKKNRRDHLASRLSWGQQSSRRGGVRAFGEAEFLMVSEHDYAFRQCVSRFFKRPYFVAAPNMNNPLDSAAQPNPTTWIDRTLHSIHITQQKVLRTTAKIHEGVSKVHSEHRTGSRGQVDWRAPPP